MAVDIPSSNGYTVHVTFGAISIVPSNGCSSGVYNVHIPYSITFTGSNIPGNLYTLQATIDCSSASGIFFNLPNAGGNGTAIASNASTGNNQCGSVTCSTIHLTIGGPGISNQTIDVNTTLPLGLAYFNVFREKNAARIEWEAYQVIAMDQVEIQKSSNLNDWSTIKIIDQINSNQLIRYTDMYPFAHKTYYRLKMVDLDGDFTYSPIRILKMAAADLWSIYPNPVRTNLQLDLSDPNATVLIKDLSGRTLIHYNSNTKNINLNLSSLNSGMYLISVNGSTQKLIKVD